MSAFGGKADQLGAAPVAVNPILTALAPVLRCDRMSLQPVSD